VLQIDCNGNVSYTVYDWSSGTGSGEQATFQLSYSVNGLSTYTPLGNGSFPDSTIGPGSTGTYPGEGIVWIWTGAFTVNNSVTSAQLRSTTSFGEMGTEHMVPTTAAPQNARLTAVRL